MSAWFVLYCKPNKESAVKGRLMMQGFEVYSPTVRKSSLCQGKKKSVCEEPLFPRYIFLKINPNETSISSVSYTPGVISFVRFGDNYSTVDESVIVKIKEYELAQLRDDASVSDFEKGDLVCINGGGFYDIIATFHEVKSDNRIVVLLNMLGAMSATSVPRKYVNKA